MKRRRGRVMMIFILGLVYTLKCLFKWIGRGGEKMIDSMIKETEVITINKKVVVERMGKKCPFLCPQFLSTLLSILFRERERESLSKHSHIKRHIQKRGGGMRYEMKRKIFTHSLISLSLSIAKYLSLSLSLLFYFFSSALHVSLFIHPSIEWFIHFPSHPKISLTINYFLHNQSTSSHERERE